MLDLSFKVTIVGILATCVHLQGCYSCNTVGNISIPNLLSKIDLKLCIVDLLVHSSNED